MLFKTNNLPPGFRFHPIDEELITHYLKKKTLSPTCPNVFVIAHIDLYKFNPWELPGSAAKALFGDEEWFFFTSRDRKYPNGSRSRYWKATGADKRILSSSEGLRCIGVKKSLMFLDGRPPKGLKTDWIMQEYRLIDDVSTLPKIHDLSMRLDDIVLCRVRRRTSSIPSQVRENVFRSPYDEDMKRNKHSTKECNDAFQGYCKVPIQGDEMITAIQGQMHLCSTATSTSLIPSQESGIAFDGSSESFKSMLLEQENRLEPNKTISELKDRAIIF